MPENTEKIYGLIISPAFKKHHFIYPGKQVTGEVTVTNDFGEGQTIYVNIYMSDMFQKDGKATFLERGQGNRSYMMADWTTLDKNQVTLKYRESATVKYTITVPENPPPGGKYTAIVFATGDNANRVENVTGAAINERMAFPILAATPGDIVNTSELLDFRTDKKLYLSWPKDPTNFILTIKNTGNVDTTPRGDIFVHRGDITKHVKHVPINENDLVILPENTREYVMPWQAQGPIISFTEGKLSVNLDYFRIGRYYALAKIGYDVNGKRVVADRVVSFWILPIQLILVILIAIIVIGGLIYAKGRKKGRKK